MILDFLYMPVTSKENFNSFQKSFYLLKIKDNKFPILITICFFTCTFYLAFFHHPVWTEQDGIYYLNFGKAILEGNAKNVTITNGQVGAPILFAFLDSIFHDAFATIKIISILSGSAIVFLSFFITKNIFDFRIALVTQLFFAFNPRLFHLSTQALNELLPVFFIMISLFFITKKQPNTIHYILIGTILGISSIFRLQSIFVLIAILIFILIRNRNIKNNVSSLGLVCIFFLIAFSPQIIYNYTTYGLILDTHSNYYIGNLYIFQTPEWHNQVENSFGAGIPSIISLDVDLFLKNYFYNLFFHNPDRLFNFGTVDNLSLIPLIPFFGLIPIFLGLVYCLKINFNKFSKVVVLSSFLFSLFFILLVGDFQHHFFLIIIIPLFPLILLNIRNIKNNFLPLIILPIIYLPLISIIPVYRSYQLLPLWLPLVILSTIFFVEVIPKLVFKIKLTNSKNLKFNTNNFRLLTFLIIGIILLLNMGFTYKLIDASFFGNTSKEIDIQTEFTNLFQKHNIDPSAIQVLQIAEILSNQPGIEDSYIMASTPSIPYHANSNFIYAEFTEGLTSDSLNDFISRKNWSDYDIYKTNIHSYPPNRLNQKLPMTDYLIYQPYNPDPNDSWHIQNLAVSEKLTILLNPDNPEIPTNFQLLYRSNFTDTVVYKINYDR